MNSKAGDNCSDLDESLPTELRMVMATEREYRLLANALGKSSFARYLVMTNGVRVGWRSNRHVYVSPIAYKVASGNYPKGFRESDLPIYKKVT